MPAFTVSRSIDINASVSDVHNDLVNFERWPLWSPWLYTEPDAKLDYRGQTGQIGHGYDWDGQMVGAGGMTLTGIETDKLAMDLQFLKPFKSKAKVYFDLQPLDDDTNRTRVTWSMDSALPFFMFFMKSTMVSMIGADYDRGLKMLKEHIETGAIKSATEVVGLVDYPSENYMGITQSSAMNTLSDSMGQAFPKVFETLQQHNIEMAGPPMSVYYRMDIKNQSCNYTAAIPITEFPGEQPDAVEPGAISGGRALKVIHTGSYQHLGNAWSCAIAQQRFQKLKPSKNQPPFEKYISDPASTEEAALITEIYIPVR